MNKEICYYTDCQLGEPIFSIVQQYLLDSGLPIVSASLNEAIDFGENEVIEGKRGYDTMVRQIISCLERSTAEYVFFCEHDILYSSSHFEFLPTRDDTFYYNENVWRWQFGADIAFRHDRMLSLSSLCVNREFALDHHKRRLEWILEGGYDKMPGREPRWARKMGYEPGLKKKKRGGFSDDDYGTWSSEHPCIDIRHKGTFSSPKLKEEDFIHKPKWWREIPIKKIDGWDLLQMWDD